MDVTIWGSSVTRQRLAQNITLLWMLNEVVEKPHENSLGISMSRVDETRHLSLQREIEIASNLAFLSATTNNNKKVMAVCVEETRNGEGIIFRVASNTGDLSRVEEGLKALGRTLEKSARRGQALPF
jgi:hypothetical protein